MGVEHRSRAPMTLFETAGVSNASDEWYTPRWIFEALAVEFDLDPCSPGSPPSVVPAKRHVTKDENGLAMPWGGSVWLNPPFSSKALWCERMVEHGNGILLIPSDPSGKTAHVAMRSAALTTFIEGSIGFTRGDGDSSGSPGFGVMLCAYGPRMARVLAAASGPFTKMLRLCA